MSLLRDISNVMQLILRARPELSETALWYLKSWIESHLSPGYVPTYDTLQALAASFLKLCQIDEPRAFRGAAAFLEAARSSPEGSEAMNDLLLAPLAQAEKALPRAVKDGRLPTDPAPVYYQVVGCLTAKETNNAGLRVKLAGIGAYPRHLALMVGRRKKTN